MCTAKVGTSGSGESLRVVPSAVKCGFIFGCCREFQFLVAEASREEVRKAEKAQAEKEKQAKQKAAAQAEAVVAAEAEAAATATVAEKDQDKDKEVAAAAATAASAATKRFAAVHADEESAGVVQVQFRRYRRP